MFIQSVLVSLLTFANTASATGNWEYLAEEDGIKVYLKKHDDSSFIGMRGETVLDYPIDKVFTIMVGTKYRQKWMDRLQSLEILDHQDSGQLTVLRMVIDMPWPFDNREFLVETRFERIDETGGISSKGHSITDERWPVEQSRVRGAIHNSVIILTPHKGGTTRINAMIHTDPKGNLPAWLVNYSQRDWPIKTLQNIAKLLEENPNVAIDPLFRVLMNAK
jgi:hypothetical protein